MRIQLTSVEETKNIDKIQKMIKSIFPNYTVTVIPNKYATEKGRQEVLEYTKEYNRKNRELINQKRRERYQRQKAEKEMKIIEENLELTKPKKLKDRER